MPTNLEPSSTTSAIVLTSTGSTSEVTSSLPFGIYTSSAEFISGASAQVAYVYKKLGGDVVDIELTTSNVYAAYEEAVLEYSYLVNIHQAKNSLGDSLGATTASFDHLGEYKAGALSSSLSGGNVALKYTKFSYGYARRFGDAAATEATVGGTQNFYSSSFTLQDDVQDYDLISAISSSVAGSTSALMMTSLLVSIAVDL